MSTYATPSLAHLTRRHYDAVYEPSEDSFLLLDSLEEDSERLKQQRPTICLEVGSGSGVVSAFLGSILGTETCYFCTDVNPLAAVATSVTGVENRVILNAVVADLATSLSRLAGLVDVLIFNPPYVVTPSAEVGSDDIVAAYAGGRRGREVMDRFFPSVSSLLAPAGVFYLVVVKENDQQDIERVLRGDGLEMATVKTRRSGPEHLSVLRFSRSASS